MELSCVVSHGFIISWFFNIGSQIILHAEEHKEEWVFIFLIIIILASLSSHLRSQHFEMTHNLKSIVTSVSEAFVFSGVSWVHYARNIDEHVCFSSVRISRITIGSRGLAFQVTAICHIIPAILVPLVAHVTTCMVTVSVCMSACIYSYRSNAHWRVCAEFESFGKWIESLYWQRFSQVSVWRASLLATRVKKDITVSSPDKLTPV